MDENDVVELTCRHLEEQGLIIKQRLSTIERGVDIIAENPLTGSRAYVEAKGGTSSRDGSARFGKPYTQTQVFDRVAKGVFTCFQLRAQYPIRESSRILLAVPDQRWFRSYLEPILSELQTAGIEVMFVSGTNT